MTAILSRPQCVKSSHLNSFYDRASLRAFDHQMCCGDLTINGEELSSYGVRYQIIVGYQQISFIYV